MTSRFFTLALACVTTMGCGGADLNAPGLYAPLDEDAQAGASSPDASASWPGDAATTDGTVKVPGPTGKDAEAPPFDATTSAPDSASAADASLRATDSATAIADASPPGEDAGVDAAPPPPPPPAAVTCGVSAAGTKMTCAPGGECCNDSRKDPAFTCTAPGQCQGSPILCGSSAECAKGLVCCGTYNVAGQFYATVTCSAGCPPAAGGFSYPRFCTFNAGECPPGTTCQAIQGLWGYSICQ